jgi:hypothetical protein
MRLTLVSQLFVTTQQGLSIRLQSLSEIGFFYKEVLDFLMQMDVFERLIYPLPSMSSIITFFHLCLSVVFYHRVSVIRIVPDPNIQS